MSTPLAVFLPVCSILLAPAATTPRQAETDAKRSAAIATGVGSGVAWIGVGLTIGAMQRRADEHVDEIEAAASPPSDYGDCCLGISIWNLGSEYVGPGLIATSAIFNAGALGASAVAGHYWAKHDVARGRFSTSRGVATTVVGSLALAAGIGLHIGGWFMQGEGCGGDVEDVERRVACWRRTTQAAMLMSSIGLLTFDVGAGLLGYGGTLLHARPTLTASRTGASLGLSIAF